MSSSFTWGLRVVALAAALAHVAAFVSVFEKGEAGYFCIKIPDLLVMHASNGSEILLALGEARVGSCSDYAETHLVMKRSADGGATWSPLRVLYSIPSSVVGNAAPVQLPRNHASHPGRVVVPFTVNNSRALVTRSDDEGLTWSNAEDITAYASKPSWGWIGFGPPASIVLQSPHSPAPGRIVVPSYHSPAHGLDGTFTHPHTVLSDDGGDSWSLGWVATNDTDKYFSNECQLAELPDGTLLLAMRTLVFSRSQATSSDGGVSFTDPVLVPDLPQPLDGVEGSILYSPTHRVLYLSSLQEANILGQRYNLTLHTSADLGATWHVDHTIDASFSAYSALVELGNGSVAILYERSSHDSIIFVPDRIVFGIAV